MRDLCLILLALLLFSSCLAYFQYQNIVRSPLQPGTKKSIELQVTPGMTLNQILEKLESEGIITNRHWISLAARFQRLGAKLKAGDYEVSTEISVASFFQILQSGKIKGRIVTIPEGYNIFEISKLFEKEDLMSSEDFLAYVRSPETVVSLTGESLASLEGYLFPESYEITKATKGTDLIKRMVKTFLERYKEFEPLQGQLGWSRHQVITLASIVEKETGAAWERPLIASVFHNRLKKRMRLQTDPTVIYAKALSTGNLEIKISRADLVMPHPYNTYHIYSLPPGPIANPGVEAIRSVFFPNKESQYLYFVSRNDGTHIFSETYEQHNKSVTEYQRNPRAREGKSWRQLSDKLKRPAN